MYLLGICVILAILLHAGSIVYVRCQQKNEDKVSRARKSTLSLKNPTPDRPRVLSQHIQYVNETSDHPSPTTEQEKLLEASDQAAQNKPDIIITSAEVQSTNSTCNISQYKN
ncbi:hypothetical protein [Ehrlichia muris]|uniref:Putative lipoprotein n=2 Tax=Ehrlichia muris TaxID=35795 RepID=A0A0F3NC14_9RICK|nr:hypothetical protein [Ehrlichia muris]KJV65608.1 putative lipoprotein [Ehrlichia cf. muris str. EmCRT]